MCFCRWCSRPSGAPTANKLKLADRTPRALTITQETAHFVMQHPACEAPIQQFKVGSGIKPRLRQLLGKRTISAPSYRIAVVIQSVDKCDVWHLFMMSLFSF